MDNKSISSLFEMYLSRSDLAESSIELKRRSFKFFLDCFGDIDPARINYAEAEDFKVFLAKNRKKSSANIYLQNFKPFFSWMFKRGYIKDDPFSQIKLYTKENNIKPIYEKDEIERLMRIADKRWKVIILLGLTSLRRSEILNLCVSDIHFDKCYIHVTPKADGENTWKWDIKDHQSEITPLPEIWEIGESKYNLHILLMDLIDQLPRRQPYVIVKENYYQIMMKRKADDTLTWRHRNQPWPNFSRSYNSLLKRAKVSPKRLHDLRATFATKMSETLSLTKTQKLMRHSSPATTARYYIRNQQEKLVTESNKICEKILCF